MNNQEIIANVVDEAQVMDSGEPEVLTADQGINKNFVTVDQAKELDEVKDVSIFATNIVNWHTGICNQAIHAMNAPEFMPGDDTAIRIEISSTNTERGAVDGKRVLHPQEVEAFKAGIRYLYDMLEELPFKFIPTDADDNIQPEYQSEVEVDAEKPEA